MRVLSIFGTRPEAIKMAPVVKALEADEEIESIVCVTAQHRDMLDQVLELFSIEPHEDLDLMRPNQSLHQLTSRIITGLAPIFEKHKPDVVLVHGDTATCFASTLAAFYSRIPVGHVEAGLRTYNLEAPFPEEAYRQLTDRIASWYFAPTPKSDQALRNEGVSADQIYITGNTVIDALLWMRANLKPLKDAEKIYGSAANVITNSSKKIILVTGHRRESFGEGFDNICKAIRYVAKENPNVEIVYPVHLNPKVQEPVFRLLQGYDNIHLIPPLDYENFVRLMDRSYLILTDSGGIQEEAPSLNKPTLVMRDCTERPEGIEAGVVKLVGTKRETISSAALELLSNHSLYKEMSQAQNPYGDGKASLRIVEALKTDKRNGRFDPKIS